MGAMDATARRLERVLGDRLIRPDDDGFAAAARLIFAGDGRAPALIARPVDANEVSEVVSAAARSRVPFSVRGPGHSYARHGLVDGGLMLDTRLLNEVRIDSERRIGSAGGGATAGAYTIAAAEHGLATGFGDTATVGVAGLTLGGGIGFLSRRDGLTIDQLLGAEIVLADGRIVRADDSEQPELFWALRGGGGNFGVVTRLDFRLHETPVVTGGFIGYEPRPETVVALLDAAREAPDSVSLMVNVMKAPPAPFIPAERHGTPIIAVLVCHSGRPDEADATLAPFRAAGTVLADLVHPQPYPELFAGPEQAGILASIRTGFTDRLDRDAAELAIDLVAEAPTPFAVLNLRPMGGAIARVPDDATAFAHRGHAVMANIAAVSPGEAGAAAATLREEWAGRAAAQLDIGGDAYVNFLESSDVGAVRGAYPAQTLQRLAAVKREVDPGNLFRSNLNIEPAEIAA